MNRSVFVKRTFLCVETDSVRICNYIKVDQHCAILILAILNVLLFSLVTTVGYSVSQESNYSRSSLFPGELIDAQFYVFCDDLSLSPDDDDATFDFRNNGLLRSSVDANGRYICNLGNITDTVYKIVERQSRLRLAGGLEAHQYLSCGNESLFPDSGHLTFYFTEISKHQSYPDDGSGVKLHWDKHPERSYIAPVVHYHSGEITVPERRMYFVYASVHVNISRIYDRDSRNMHRPQRFTLRICRSIKGYELTLLQKSELFNVSNSDAISSLNVGSYLQLPKDGVIYASVSDANALVRDSRGTTFGMFPL